MDVLLKMRRRDSKCESKHESKQKFQHIELKLKQKNYPNEWDARIM